MPNWTLGNIISYATKRIGNRADLSVSDCSFWANQAQDDMIREVPELLSEKIAGFSVSSGDSLLTIPADMYEPIDLSYQTTNESCKTLRQLDPAWADAQGYYPVGEPQGFFFYADKIQLWPSADSSANTTDASSARSYQLRYRANPATMSNLTDVPSIVTLHRVGLLYKTEQYLHDQVGNIDEAAAAGARYVSYIASLKDAMARRESYRGRKSASLPMRQSRRGSTYIDLRDSDTAWWRW